MGMVTCFFSRLFPLDAQTYSLSWVTCHCGAEAPWITSLRPSGDDARCVCSTSRWACVPGLLDIPLMYCLQLGGGYSEDEV